MLRTRRTAAAVAALSVLLATAIGCAPGVPTDIISVPGSYTFSASRDLAGNYVRPQGTVAFCIHQPASLRASGSNAALSITFGGTSYVSPGPMDNTVVTPVIGPGCGTLSASAINVLEGTLQSITVTLDEATP